jgi:glycosyltransferase involved in cell wall biosynthesis
MSNSEQYDLLDKHECCVIIPTYNNERTLENVIRGVLELTDNIIVVNDGSSDQTRNILGNFNHLKIIHLDKNRGKGYALRQGFAAALLMGYEYAITIDSDGQHSPEDLPKFIDKLEEEPGTLIIGARNLKQESVPGGTSFGNRFSNFWTWLETGYKLPDTQSGYRLYPIKRLESLKFYTRRFEFEIEVLVRSVWKGIPIKTVPVSVIYPGKAARVSHFRPFTDFARISLLNSVLVILALLIYRPRMIYREMSKMGYKVLIRKYLISPEESNFKKSTSIAVGVFMGIAPVWGWQMAIALALAMLLKLNKAITLIASNISIPPAIPFILAASYLTGGLVLHNKLDISLDAGITFEFVKNNLLQYIVGALVFGAAMGLLAGLVTWLILSIFRKR